LKPASLDLRRAFAWMDSGAIAKRNQRPLTRQACPITAIVGTHHLDACLMELACLVGWRISPTNAFADRTAGTRKADVVTIIDEGQGPIIAMRVRRAKCGFPTLRADERNPIQPDVSLCMVVSPCGMHSDYIAPRRNGRADQIVAVQQLSVRGSKNELSSNHGELCGDNRWLG
jgi:hypothetical protein